MRGMFDRFLRRRLLAVPKPAVAMIQDGCIVAFGLYVVFAALYLSFVHEELPSDHPTSELLENSSEDRKDLVELVDAHGRGADPTPIEQCLENFKLSVPNCAPRRNL